MRGSRARHPSNRHPPRHDRPAGNGHPAADSNPPAGAGTGRSPAGADSNPLVAAAGSLPAAAGGTPCSAPAHSRGSSGPRRTAVGDKRLAAPADRGCRGTRAGRRISETFLEMRVVGRRLGWVWMHVGRPDVAGKREMDILQDGGGGSDEVRVVESLCTARSRRPTTVAEMRSRCCTADWLLGGLRACEILRQVWSKRSNHSALSETLAKQCSRVCTTEGGV